jgi:hypothetical protein
MICTIRLGLVSDLNASPLRPRPVPTRPTHTCLRLRLLLLLIGGRVAQRRRLARKDGLVLLRETVGGREECVVRAPDDRVGVARHGVQVQTLKEEEKVVANKQETKKKHSHRNAQRKSREKRRNGREK